MDGILDDGQTRIRAGAALSHHCESVLGPSRVSTAEPQATEGVRAAEVIAALCLGTDLGMGFPFELSRRNRRKRHPAEPARGR